MTPHRDPNVTQHTGKPAQGPQSPRTRASDFRNCSPRGQDHPPVSGWHRASYGTLSYRHKHHTQHWSGLWELVPPTFWRNQHPGAQAGHGRAGGRRSAGPPRAAQGADGMARGRWGGSGGPRTHVCLTCAAAGLAPQHGTGCEAHGGPPGGRSPVRSFPTTATAGWGVQTPTSCLRMGSGAVGRQPKRVWVSPCARAARASASSGCTHPLGRAVP